MSSVRFLVYCIILCVLASVSYVVYQYRFSSLLSEGQKPVTIELARGAAIQPLITQLQEAQLIQHPRLLAWWLKWVIPLSDFKAGEYRVTSSLSLHGLLYNMRHALVVQHPFAIIDGWTFAQVLRSLDRASYLQHTVHRPLTNKMRTAMGLQSGENPEGLFYPDTYFATIRIIRRRNTQ